MSITGSSRAGLVPLIVLCTAQLMVLLDATVVNVALPAIAGDLGLQADEAPWVITGYYLAFGGLLLLGGRAGDLLGRRRVFLAGVALFTLASLLGGFADSALTLIGSRVLQGVGAAAAAPSVLALIITTYPEVKARAKALAGYAAMSSVGAATGLVAGGLLTEWLSWRWAFFINVPLGLAVLCLSLGLLRETSRGTGRFDLLGAVTISGGLALFVYAVCRAQAYGWGDRIASVCLAVAVGIILGFVLLETRAPRPLLPLHLLIDRRRAVAFGATFGVGACVFVLFYFGSQYVQSVLDASPAVAGLQFVPFSVILLLTSQVMARSGGRIAPVHAVPAGALLTAAAMLWLSRIQPDSSFVSAVLGPIVLCAFGAGLMMVPLAITVLGHLAPQDAGVGAGLFAMAQHIGGTVGVAVAATVASQATQDRLRAGLQLRGARSELLNQALVAGYSRVFVVAGILLAFVAVLTAVGLRRPRSVEATALAQLARV